MMEEYSEWCEKHPNATDEERSEVWDKCIKKLEAWNFIINMFASYR